MVSGKIRTGFWVTLGENARPMRFPVLMAQSFRGVAHSYRIWRLALGAWPSATGIAADQRAALVSLLPNPKVLVSNPKTAHRDPNASRLNPNTSRAAPEQHPNRRPENSPGINPLIRSGFSLSFSGYSAPLAVAVCAPIIRSGLSTGSNASPIARDTSGQTELPTRPWTIL